MRIVFIGSVQFSFRLLKHLCDLGENIVGVCTKKNSKFNSDHLDLSSFCNEKEIPWMYTENVNSTETIEWIESLKPDVIFCFGWSNILKGELINLAPLGTVGFHPASLPKNRGRHPLIWALALGLKETGSTFFLMDENTDSGDILSQERIIIEEHYDASDIYESVTIAAMRQIEKLASEMKSGKHKTHKQNESESNYWRKRNSSDGKIDWRMSSRSIHNLVKALARPYVGAHFVVDGKEIKLWQTQPIENFSDNLEPGKVIGISEMGPIVKCGEGAICIVRTEPECHLIEGAYL
jgi:methionyl-tRNA formyltransferase